MRKIYSLVVVIATLSVSAQNLVKNSSFEEWKDNGKLVDWYTPKEIAQETAKVNSGNYSVAVKSPEKNAASLGAKDIEVVAGKTYVYSGWYLQETDNTSVKYWGQWRTESALIDNKDLQSPQYISGASSEWKQFRVEAVAPEGSEKARLSFRVYTAKGKNEGSLVYVDDIMFCEKESLSVVDVAIFDKQVKMNTLVNDVLVLQLPSKSTVNIYSVDGKLLSSNRVSNGGSVDFRSFGAGTYLVTVEDGQNKISRKVIKK